jgi:flagellar hook-associated protein 2
LPRRRHKPSFSIENTLQINLYQKGDNPVTLRIVPDKGRILDDVDSVLDTFNGLIRIANSRTEATKEHFGASKLISEMKNLETTYQDELEACGFKASEQGMLSLDDALAAQAAEDGGMESLFTRENGFIARVLDKAETITINPMDYLDKVIVTYPDSSSTAYANPYITSMYSGLFFNSYC